MKDMLKKVFKHWEMFLVIFLILEFVVFGAANPKFLRPQSIMNSIVNYISVCIISLFVTMVMITGGIDIQAPAIIGLSSIIGAPAAIGGPPAKMPFAPRLPVATSAMFIEPPRPRQ